MNIQDVLNLSKPPIAIGFLNAVPENVPRWSGGPVPSGCTFWREAMKGKVFYTEAADHHNCAVGAYTHGITLPTARASELQDTVGFMVASGYIDITEVPGIPTLEKPPAYIAYAPADTAPFRPDAVLVAARPAAAMLLYEAALRAGAAGAPAGILGRPGCAVVPLTARTRSAALSLGCKGNRTFTGLADDEMYFAVPGARWEAVAARIGEIVTANRAMEAYYQGRLAQFPIV